MHRRPCGHPVRRWRIEALLSVLGRRLLVVDAIESDADFVRRGTEIQTPLCGLCGTLAGAYMVPEADTAP
jgi:hypothetical protein